MSSPSDNGTQDALVTGAFSLRMMLRIAGDRQVTARIKGKNLRPVCGDRVRARPIPNEPEWLITEIEPRRNELARPDRRGRKEVLAANLTCVVVMAAAEPAPDWFVVDRYLAAAENMGTSAIVVFNKSDLDGDNAAAAEALADYERCGYRTMYCSAVTGENIDLLAAALANETTIIVGQSGVGKSSIINELIQDAGQRTAALSGSTGEGRHTTVNSVMLELPHGGVVIDSPGVRDYAPALESADEVIRGFREIDKMGQSCRFANCRHLREPDCTVKAAVEAGTLSRRRYESYRRLMALTRELAEKR